MYEDIAQPSTSHSIKKRGLTSSSSESNSDSDSDYTFRRSRKYQSRTRKHIRRSTTSKRRNHSVETRIRNRTSRNLSSSGESDIRKKVPKRNTQRRRRLSSSSDSSSHEVESKPIDEQKSRTSQYSGKGTVRVRKDLIKKETRYSDDESFSSNNSTESDEIIKNIKSRSLRKSKRKYTTSSSDFDMGRSERIIRTRGKTRQAPDIKESHRKESRYKNDRQSISRSSSVSSYTSQKEKRDSSRRREAQRDMSDDDGNWITRDVSRKDREFKSKTREEILSSSDYDDDFRSHSQCSNYSSKSYTHKKKSKHKDRHKSKKRKRSSSRTHSSNRPRLTRRHPA